MSVALLASGLLLAVYRAAVVSVDAATLLATALVVVGAGLVIGAWLGRARWLIAVGVALAIALLAALTTPRVPVAGGVGDRAAAPAALAEVRPAYRLGIGNSTLDLSRVAFAGARRDVAVSVGAGELTVVVPRTVAVTVQARVGLGELRVFGTTMDGNGLRRTVTVPAEGASQGRLELRAEVGVGQLEVRRATT